MNALFAGLLCAFVPLCLCVYQNAAGSAVMDFQSLQDFIVVAEELHFGRAAKRLNIVQPALSRRIQKLEEGLRFQLFQRNNRRIQLTAAGNVFLAEARSLLASLAAAVLAGQRASEGKTGWINIGFIGSAILDLLPAILRTFRKQAPQVELMLSDLTTVEQIQRLQQRRIHVGFTRGPVAPQEVGLVFEIVAREPLAVALPQHHPLAKRARIRTASLAKEGFIVFPNHPMSTWDVLVHDICRAAGFEPNVVQRTVQIQTAISLVSAGIGISLVPVTAKNLTQKGVVYRRLEEKTTADLLVVYREDETSPAVLHFLSTTRDVARRNQSKAR
jgi:DNA-binding transcriptional LysR family regulator